MPNRKGNTSSQVRSTVAYNAGAPVPFAFDYGFTEYELPTVTLN